MRREIFVDSDRALSVTLERDTQRYFFFPYFLFPLHPSKGIQRSSGRKTVKNRVDPKTTRDLSYNIKPSMVHTFLVSQDYHL